MSKILNIFDYSDYRKYLRECVLHLKKQRLGSLGQLAEVAQVHGTFLSHVLSGQKDLSLEQAALIGGHFQLSQLELDYFFCLIQIERSGNLTLKKYWLDKKEQLLKEKNKLSQRFEAHKQLSEEDKSIFYSSWLYSAAWAALAINNGLSVDELSQSLKVSRLKTVEILQFLSQTGLCIEESSKYVVTNLHIHIPNESPLVVRHHYNWRVKSMQKMDERNNQNLFFTAPMSLSKDDFEKLRESINLLIKNVVLTAKDSKAEVVADLNIDFFLI